MIKPLHLLPTLLIACLLLSANVATDFDKVLAAFEAGDYETALREWKPLAEQGRPDAQLNLGIMYDNGYGVIQDHVYAHMWFNIASANGLEKARENRDLVANKLTPNQMADAQKLARECVKKDYRNC